jgi:hypothetical protein
LSYPVVKMKVTDSPGVSTWFRLNNASPPDKPVLPIRLPFRYNPTPVTSLPFPLPDSVTVKDVRVKAPLLGFVNTTWPDATPEVPWTTVRLPGAPVPCTTGTSTSVAVAVWVTVGVKLGVKLGVELGVQVDVGVGVFVELEVAVGVTVGVSVGVGVFVAVDVGVKLAVKDSVAVAVFVGVPVRVGVSVCV